MRRISFHPAGEEPANGDIFRNDNGIPSLWLSGFRIGNPNPSQRQCEQIRFFRGCLLLKKLYSLSFRLIISSPGLFYPVPLFGLSIHRFGNPPSTFSNKRYFGNILLFCCLYHLSEPVMGYAAIGGLNRVSTSFRKKGYLSCIKSRSSPIYTGLDMDLIACG